MKLREAVRAAAVSLLLVSPASAQRIGVYWDPTGAACSTQVAPFAAGTMYVLAVLEGAAAGGITGGECRVEGFPAEWFPSVLRPLNAPCPSACDFCVPADLFGVGAINVFPTCCTGDNCVVPLFVVNYFVTSVVSNRQVVVRALTTPTNPSFPCPAFWLCDAPVYTKVCLGSNLTVCRNPEPPLAMDATCSTSGEAFLNPIPTRNCTVAVQDASWSTIKGLYQD